MVKYSKHLKSSTNAATYSFINWVHAYIEREKENRIGITLFYMMFGSVIASITAALGTSGEFSLTIVLISAVFAIAVIACVISVQTFKICTWFFIANILINVGLLFYQLIPLVM